MSAFEKREALISVIVPVYNVEKYIGECIDSILAQTYRNLEIILIDDGSKDGSGRILDDYARKDVRVKVVHKENTGVSDTRNRGVGMSTGEYLYIMDSDDYLEHDALEQLYNLAVESNADIVMGDYYTFTEDLVQTPHHFFSKDFVTSDPAVLSAIQKMILHFGFSPYKVEGDSALGIAPPWTRLVKASLVRDNKLAFDPYVKGIFDDGLFALHEMEYARSLAYTQKFIYHYRLLSSSLIHKFNPNRVMISDRIIERLNDFSGKYHKGEDFQKAVDARIIMLFVNLLDTYYLNDQYDKKGGERTRQIRAVAEKPEYARAFRNVDKAHLTTTQRTVVTLSNMKLVSFIPIAFKLRSILKK